MKPRLCSGPWRMQVIDIITTGEYCSRNSTCSVDPIALFPLYSPLQGCRTACNWFLVLHNKTFRSVEKVRGYNKPEIGMEVMLASHLAARFAGLYAMRTSGYVLRSAPV